MDKGEGMKREDKQKQAEALREELRKARTVILASFERLTVAQDTELRRKLAETGAKYKVVKNTLIERAAQGTPAESVTQELRGTTSLAYTESDPVALAKALTAYAKENPALTFKAGVIEGRVIAMDELVMVANLPSREQLFSRVLFLVNAPARRVAFTVSAVGRNLAYVIEQAVEQKKFGVGNSTAEPKAEQGTAEEGSSDAYKAVERAIDHVLNGPPELRREHGQGFLLELRSHQVDPHNFEDAFPYLMTEGRIPAGAPGRTPSVLDLQPRLSVSERENLKKHYLRSLQKFEEDFAQDTLGGKHSDV